MARTMTAAMITELAKDSGAKTVLLTKLEFDSGDVRAWSGRGDLTFDSEVYLGAGDMGGISPMEEGRQSRAYGLAYRLSGVPATNLSLALDEDVVGRPATIWLGALDSDYALIADPLVIFRGRMDSMTVSLGATAQVSVNLINRMAAWDVVRERLYTAAGQAARGAGKFRDDTGMRFVSQTIERVVIWGVAP